MRHDFVKAIGTDGLDALLLVDFIDRHAFVLQCEEEEHELVDLLLHELFLLLFLSEFEPHMLLVLHKHEPALGKHVVSVALGLKRLIRLRLFRL